MDHDNNQRITFSEFTFWIEHNYELQDFLLKYAQTQTFGNMKRRFESIFTIFKHFFNNAAGGHDQKLATCDDLFGLLETEAKKYIASEDLTFLKQILL